MPVEIFCCYAHEDEALLKKLKKHLRSLQRQGHIDVWHDRNISAGTEWAREINHHLNSAQIILLLVSSEFIDSDYCYSFEMKRALERHQRGEARVIPILLRPVYWEGTPFSELAVLPKNAKPLVSWRNRDDAFVDIVVGIFQVIRELQNQRFDLEDFAFTLKEKFQSRNYLVIQGIFKNLIDREENR